MGITDDELQNRIILNKLREKPYSCFFCHHCKRTSDKFVCTQGMWPTSAPEMRTVSEVMTITAGWRCHEYDE